MEEGNKSTLEDLLIRYGIIMHRRFHAREKARFLVALSKEFEALGYKTQVKTVKARQFKVRNLYVGNANVADTIVTTYYDTPTVGSSTYRVLEKTPKKTFSVILGALPLVVTMAIGAYFILHVGLPNWSQGLGTWQSISSLLFTLFLFALLLNFRHGMGRRRNTVQNTSSVLAIIDAAMELDENLRHKVAFVLTDSGCINHFGAKLIPAQINDKDQTKTYVMLDGVGSLEGPQMATTSTLMTPVKKAASEVYPDMEPVLNLEASQAKQRKLFKRTILLSGGKRGEDGNIVVSRNLGKDATVQMLNHVRLASEFIRFFVNQSQT